jgi:TRAP-type uncharacterized transport system substrate-binding protein
MRRTLFFILLPSAAVLLIAYAAYAIVDPLPPRQLTIAAGPVGSEYETFAKEYARILARHGVMLEIRNSAGAVENLELLRDPASGVQAALTTFGFTEPADTDTLYSLGGIFNSAIYVFYRNDRPVTLFGQFRGKRLAIGIPGTALRSLFLQVLGATDAIDASTQFVPLDFPAAIDALVAGQIDVAVVPRSDETFLQQLLHTPGIGLMNVVQAEALSKTVPGLKHVVLSRGLIDLSRDVPSSDVDLLASRNRLLVRKDLHPALQYLLLEAMREVHRGAGPFNALGEFPAEQPNDLPLSPTAQVFYRSGPLFWERYTSFWVSSLLSRTMFFIIPVLVALIPILGYAPRLYRWIYLRRIDQLHRALGRLERDLDQTTTRGAIDQERRMAEIRSAVLALKVPRSFELDLDRLRIHLHMVEEELRGITAGPLPASGCKSSDIAPAE